jgi:hypothetical protein
MEPYQPGFDREIAFLRPKGALQRMVTSVMASKEAGKTDHIGGIKRTMNKASEPDKFRIDCIHKKLVGRIFHKFHQLQRFGQNGLAVSPREGSCKQAGDLHILLL